MNPHKHEINTCIFYFFLKLINIKFLNVSFLSVPMCQLSSIASILFRMTKGHMFAGVLAYTVK